MKMKGRGFLICVLLLQASVMANAIVVQKLLLKNGSELDGYISMQCPGKVFTFKAEQAIINISGKEVTAVNDVQVNVKKLSAGWVSWAEKHNAFVGLGDNRFLVLSDIQTKQGSILGVRVLEKGAQLKYIDMAEKDYSLNWDTIAAVRVSKRPINALTGVNRMYKLDTGEEYEGQYVEEIPGKTLSLYRDNGVVEVFETNKVIKYAMRKINPNQPLFEQTELIDLVKLKDNSLLTGIIIEQNFRTKDDLGNYLLLQSGNDMVRSVSLADVVEYRKEVNTQYKPLFDILLRQGEFVINRLPTNTWKVKEEGSFIILPKDTCRVIVEKKLPSTEVVVETHFDQNTLVPTWEIVKVRKLTDKKQSPVGFTFEDIVKSTVHPHSAQVSVNGTARFVYTVSESGLYAMYNSKEKTVIPFIVK